MFKFQVTLSPRKTLTLLVPIQFYMKIKKTRKLLITVLDPLSQIPLCISPPPSPSLPSITLKFPHLILRTTISFISFSQFPSQIFLWRNKSVIISVTKFLWRSISVTNFPSQKIVTDFYPSHFPSQIVTDPSQINLWRMKLWRSAFHHNFRHKLKFFVTIPKIFRHNLTFFFVVSLPETPTNYSDPSSNVDNLCSQFPSIVFVQIILCFLPLF